jgi:hypothetical protein
MSSGRWAVIARFETHGGLARPGYFGHQINQKAGQHLHGLL